MLWDISACEVSRKRIKEERMKNSKHNSRSLSKGNKVSNSNNKNVDNIVFGIYPHACAGETRVPEGFRRCQGRRVGIGIYRIIFFRFIKTITATTHIAMISCEKIYRFRFQVTFAIQSTSVYQHLV